MWYSVKLSPPPEKIRLSIKMDIIGPGAPERRTWVSTGIYNNGKWSISQTPNNDIKSQDEPTHWKYIR